MSTWSWARRCRERGIPIEWGPNEQHTRRHAYPHRCITCHTENQHRRTHLPHALCGNAWGPDWPITDNPTLPTCGTCRRLMEDNP